MTEPTQPQLKLTLATAEISIYEALDELNYKICADELNGGWSGDQIKQNFAMRHVRILRNMADVIERCIIP